MITELTTATLRELSVPERKELIYQKSLTIDATHITDEELHKAYKIAKAIQPILVSYFHYQIEQDNQNKTVLESEDQSILIRSNLDKFTNDFIEWLERDFEIKKAKIFPNPSNLFELCGATLLITSNSVTRTLSTRMGHLWEKNS